MPAVVIRHSQWRQQHCEDQLEAAGRRLLRVPRPSTGWPGSCMWHHECGGVDAWHPDRLNLTCQPHIDVWLPPNTETSQEADCLSPRCSVRAVQALYYTLPASNWGIVFPAYCSVLNNTLMNLSAERRCLASTHTASEEEGISSWLSAKRREKMSSGERT